MLVGQLLSSYPIIKLVNNNLLVDSWFSYNLMFYFQNLITYLDDLINI